MADDGRELTPADLAMADQAHATVNDEVDALTLAMRAHIGDRGQRQAAADFGAMLVHDGRSVAELALLAATAIGRLAVLEDSGT